MAVSFRQENLKVYDQLTNGVNFTENTSKFKNNLAGFVGGNYKIEVDFVTSVYYFDDSDTTEARVNIDANPFIEIAGVNWLGEGFRDADEIEFWFVENANRITYSADIKSIQDDRIFLENVSLISGTGLTSGVFTGEKNVRLKNQLPAINYSFGLVENSGEFSRASLLTGADQSFYGALANTNNGTNVNLIPKGANKDWQSGGVVFTSLGSTFLYTVSTDDTTPIIGYEFNYKVEHIFTLNPFFEDGQIPNLTNENGVIAPSYLQGDNSLKYVYEADLRGALSNPNRTINVINDNNLGSVAYYNENFNGFNNPFEVLSVDYEDVATGQPTDGVSPSSETYINARIRKPSGNITANHNVSFNIFKASSQEEYTNTTATDLKENFIFDNLLADVGQTVTGSGVIKELVVTAVLTAEFTIRAKVSYNSAEQLKINSGDFFVASLAVQDSSLTAGNEDAVNLLLDVELYEENIDIAGLATMPIFNLRDIGLNEDYSSIYAFNEDNIDVRCKMVLDLTKQAYINSIQLKLLAYNPTTANYFELDNFDLNYNEIISANNQQLLSYDSNRAYPNSLDNNQNRVEIYTEAVGATTTPEYYINFGQKINWKSWIENKNADTIFYDQNEPKNNLNFKASNYSDLQGYEIRVGVLANIFGVDDLGRSGNTDYLFLSQKITTADYDINEDINGTIELFDVETGVSLGTSPRVEKDTLFKVTWQNVTYDNNITIAINRMEKAGQQGNSIFELSNKTDYVGGLLKPTAGNTRLSVVQNGANIEATCLIDYTQLTSGESYNLSARVNGGADTDPNAKLKTSGAVKLKTDQVVKLKAI